MKLGLVYRLLSRNEIIILKAIEKLILRYEYVPLEVIVKRTKLPENKVSLSIDKLNRLKLVKTQRMGARRLVKLTYLGLDMIAINSLVRRNVIEAIGDKIGVGKESDLYMVLVAGGEEAVAKFLRIGRTSFRKTKLVRDWAEDPRYKWFIQSKIAAEREFSALKELINVGGCVPHPIAKDRHVVVTEYINGLELYLKPELKDPMSVYKSIVDTLRLAYLKVGIVHGDLSEYNVLVENETGRAYIIDWPQYVYRGDPRADDLLKRDVHYITRFFVKNYGLKIELQNVYEYIKGVRNEF